MSLLGMSPNNSLWKWLSNRMFPPPFSNDSFEAEPEEKRRKTSNVVIDQSASDAKVLIDNARDSSSSLEEVTALTRMNLLFHVSR